MAYRHEDKTSGQLIRSADWNTMGHELERLETDKVNRAGDTVAGDLRIAGKLTGADGRFDSNWSIGGSLTVSGNVGLGTTDPGTNKLRVAGTTDIVGTLRVGGAATLASGLSVGGNVGIGAPTPGRPLHIASTGNDLLMLQSTKGGTDNAVRLDFQSYASSDNQLSPTARLAAIDNGQFSSHLTFWTKESGADKNQLVERMRISSAGNVAIGAADPGAFKLLVNGDVRANKYVVQDGVDGGGSRGIWMWSAGDSNWGIYMSTPGAGKSLAGGTAVGGSGFGTHAIRLRTFSDVNNGLIYENSSEQLNFSVRASDGYTYVRGGLTVGGAITPSAGNSTSNGIAFPNDPFGGGGDTAWIRYHNARGGEKGTLEIGIANDGDDHIVLKPAGNVGIGVDDPAAKLDVAGTTKTQKLQLANKWLMSGVGDGWANDDWLRLYNTASNDYYGGLAAGRLWSSSGSLSGSDLRMKHAVATLDQPLEQLLMLRGVRFRWRSAGEAGGYQLGLIAQEVETVFPELVETGPDGMKGINYDGLVAPLIEALRQQQSQIAELRAEIQMLKSA